MKSMVSRLVGTVVLGVIVLAAAPAAWAGITLLNLWGGWGYGDGQFRNARGVLVHSNGYVYVSDGSNHRVQKFDRYGIYQSQFGNSGSGDGQFSTPNAMNEGTAGEIFVVDVKNHRVQKFEADGIFLGKFGSEGTTDGQFKSSTGVAVNSAGHIYVAEWGSSSAIRVQEFEPDFTFVRKWGSSGTANGQFKNLNGVDVDADGNVYVVDANNNRIQKFTGTGTHLATWGSTTAGSGPGQFNYPVGVEIGATGHVYVADTKNNRVQKFDSDGTFLEQFGSYGSDPGQFNWPFFVSVAPTGEVYVSEYYNNRVQRWFDSDAWVSGTNEFTNPAYGPTDVGVGSDGGVEQLLGLSQTLTSAKTLIVGGTTTVYADGTLTLDDGSLTSPSVEVHGTLGGTGTITGNVNVESGGIHAPGLGTGTQTILGSYSLDSGSTLQIEIDSLTAFDQVVADSVAIDGATLDVILGYDPILGDSFTIIDNLDGSVTGSLFTGLPEGQIFGIAGPGGMHGFWITSAGGDGNDVVLTAVPEPCTMLLAALGAIGLLLWRRRGRGR